MPSLRTLSEFLDLPGYRITRFELNEEGNLLTFWIGRSRDDATYACGACGRRTRRVHDSRERELDDLPWGPRRVRLVVERHRVRCRRCGTHLAEALPFARPRSRMTRRLEDRIGLECQSAPVSEVAERWGISWDRAKAADMRFLADWAEARPRRRVRHVGLDEVSYAKRHRYYTVLCDLDEAEVIDLVKDRTREATDSLLQGGLSAEQRRSVKAACIDMWRPYREAVAEHLPGAEVVFDKFHVMQHVGRAVDETRRAEFFRQGAEARAAMRGKRWLLLSRWKNLAREGRRRLAEALDLNRRLFKAYYLKEEIHQLWRYTYEGAARRFWETWKRSLRWQRMPAFERLVATIEKHFDGILAHCRHKVRFGVVESINAIVKSIIRRARGYRDHSYVRLKIMWATAHPSSGASL
jgi:transposase